MKVGFFTALVRRFDYRMLMGWRAVRRGLDRCFIDPSHGRIENVEMPVFNRRVSAHAVAVSKNKSRMGMASVFRGFMLSHQSHSR